MANYSTIQQHEPLRIPSSFDKQGKALIVQLDEIFDDIYRRFGRLKVSDLGSELRDLCLVKNEDGKYVSIDLTLDNMSIEFSQELNGKISKTEQYQDADSIVTAAELYVDGELTAYSTTEQTAQAISSYVTNALGDYSTTQQMANAIALAVGDCYGKVSGITITSSGIDITGSKYIKLASGNKLILNSGGTIEIKASNNTDNMFKMDDTGIQMRSGSNISIQAGAELKIRNADNSANAILISKDGIALNTSGSLTMNSGSSFSIHSGNFSISSTGSATLKGGVEINSSRELLIKSGANMYIKSGGVMEVESGGKMSLLSGGAFYVRSGGGIYFQTSDLSANRFSMDDNGIKINTGSALTINTGGNMQIKTGGTFSIQSGNFDIDNTGATTLKGGVEILSGRDLLIKAGGNMEIKPNGTLTIKTGGVFSVQSGNFDIDNTGAATLKGGVEILSGRDLLIKANGNMVVESNGNLSIKTGGSLTVESGNFGVNSSGAAQLKGTIYILSGKHLYINNGGEMEVESGGKMRLLSGGAFYVRSGGGIYFTTADLTANRFSMNDSGINISSGGAINVEGGDVNIKSGSTFTVFSSTAINFITNNQANRISLATSGITVYSGADVNIMSGSGINIMTSDETANAVTLGNSGVEIFSGSKLRIRAGAELDILANSALKIKSSGSMTIDSGGEFTINSGSTFTLYSSNIDIDNTGLVVKQGNLRGSHYNTDGTPMLSRKDIVVSSSSPSSPKAGTLWVKPAAGTVIVNYSCGVANNTVANGFVGTLSSSNNTASSGSNNIYRLQFVIHANTSSGNGADFSIYVNDTQGNIRLLYPVHVSPGYYSGGTYYGDTVIDIQATSASWFGSDQSMLLAIYATGGDHLDSYKIPPGNITLTCTSQSGSSSGWADCEIKVYQ